MAVAAGAGTGQSDAIGAPAGVFESVGTSSADAAHSVAIGSSAGTATADGILSAANGQAAGTAAIAGTSAIAFGGAGVSNGIGVGAGVGGISWESVASETDTAIAVHGLALVATGIATTDASPQAATYASSGAASSTVELLEKRRSVGSAAGVSAVSFQANLEEILTSSGAAAAAIDVAVRATSVSSGAVSSTLDVVHHRFVIGRSAGASAAIAQAIGGTNGVGAAAGTSTAAWVGRGVKTGAATAAGAATVSGILSGVARLVGAAAGAASAAAARSGRQIEILVSGGEAEDALQFPAPSVYPVFWSNTIEASGATWEGLPFNSMVEVDGVIYAASASGLHRMDDLADDNGTDVLSTVEWDLFDINHSDYKQRTRSVYISAVADGPFTIKVENKQGSFSYQTHLPSSSKTKNHRAPFGRGITSRAMRLTLLQNRYFSAGDINIGTGDTTRRI
jgi:hypothetical protein